MFMGFATISLAFNDVKVLLSFVLKIAYDFASFAETLRGLRPN